jgi:hypothetical protein
VNEEASVDVIIQLILMDPRSTTYRENENSNDDITMENFIVKDNFIERFTIICTATTAVEPISAVTCGPQQSADASKRVRPMTPTVLRTTPVNYATLLHSSRCRSTYTYNASLIHVHHLYVICVFFK